MRDDMFLDKQGNPLCIERFEELFMDDEYRVIERTPLIVNGEPVFVSTVWLGINHNWHDDGPPIIFETMIFGGESESDCFRYSTEEQAKAGHKKAVEDLVRQEVKK